MNGYRLTLRQPLEAYLNAEPLVPERVLGLGLEELLEMPLRLGGKALPLGRLFSAEPLEEERLILRGDLSLALGVGAGMTRGDLLLEGSAGDRAGRGMSGGTLTVTGHAAHCCWEGMQGGFAVLRGDAGERCAKAMRRGILVLKGNAGAGLGCSMAGGTVVLMGSAGPHLGENMRRGTLVLARGSAPEGFADTGRYREELPFLPLLFRELSRRGADLPPALTRCAWNRWRGDAAALNKGELFLMAGEEVCASEF